MFDLSMYGGHNASITLAKDKVILEVIELERFLNVKNMGLLWYDPSSHLPFDVLNDILKYFNKKYGLTEIENIICNQEDIHMFKSNNKNILEFFNAKNLIEVYHQEGHAANAFYQSPFEEAVIISFDGGGNDGCFNFYYATRETGPVLYRKDLEYNLGEKYAEIGFYCKSLSQVSRAQGYLVNPGKLMGLAGYGNVLSSDMDTFKKYYKGHHMSYETRMQNYIDDLQTPLGLPSELNGQIELDVVATSQKVFEELFESLCEDDFKKSKNLCLAGGCALNVLNNTKLEEKMNTFISPNPDDRGLSLGFMLHYLKPELPFDSTYIGSESWDKHSLHEYVYQYKGTSLNINELAIKISEGHIFGIVRDGCEHGPRALGNRSIICSAGHGMKDILNVKVKRRETYRPFAPVVRLEDVSKYFHWNRDARWMTYSPLVKSEWKDALSSITHADGTARVQTVTRDQNQFLYDLLTELDKIMGFGVMINTSFNIAGKPILNTYRDAIWMLENTEMDGLVLENYLIMK
jgi:carbamoyltransferase